MGFARYRLSIVLCTTVSSNDRPCLLICATAASSSFPSHTRGRRLKFNLSLLGCLRARLPTDLTKLLNDGMRDMVCRRRCCLCNRQLKFSQCAYTVGGLGARCRCNRAERQIEPPQNCWTKREHERDSRRDASRQRQGEGFMFCIYPCAWKYVVVTIVPGGSSARYIGCRDHAVQSFFSQLELCGAFELDRHGV